MGIFDFLKKRQDTEELEPEAEDEGLTLNEQARLSRVNTEREFEPVSEPVDEGAEMESRLKDYLKSQEEPEAPAQTTTPTPAPEPEPVAETTQQRIDRLKLEIEEKKLQREAAQYTRTGEFKSAAKQAAQDMFKRTTGRSGQSERVIRAVRGVASLGGQVKINKPLIKRYYSGGGNSKIYDLSAMQILTTPRRVSGGMSKPNTDLYSSQKMRGLTTPGAIAASELHTMPKPAYTQPTRQAGVEYGRLRKAGSFDNNSPIAQAARGGQSPVTQPKAMAFKKGSAVTIGGSVIKVKAGEKNLGEWPGEVWFRKMSSGESVKGDAVHLVRIGRSGYRFAGIDPGDGEDLSRTISKEAATKIARGETPNFAPPRRG